MNPMAAARRVVHVNTRRAPARQPGPALEGQPQPAPGTRTYLRGVWLTVLDVEGDRVVLQGDTQRFPVGLLLHWMNYAWRVSAAVDRAMILEAWGPNYLNSPKEVDYA